MLLLRRIFFYLFIVLYLILCPWTILYALGYLYRPGAEQGIVKTGLISLSTVPPGASVYVGKSRYTQKTPATLRDLLPGDYPVRLVLKHYRPWRETLPVEAEKATLLEKILLLPDTWKEEIILKDSFETLIPLPGNEVFLLGKGSRLGEMWVYDWKRETIRPLLPTASPFREAKLLAYFSVRESPCLLLRVDFKQRGRYLWLEIEKEETILRDLSNLFPERPLWVAWDPRDKEQLFAFYNDGYLNRLEIASKAIYPKVLINLRGFGLWDRAIYVLTEDNTFERTDLGGRAKRSFSRKPS